MTSTFSQVTPPSCRQVSGGCQPGNPPCERRRGCLVAHSIARIGKGGAGAGEGAAGFVQHPSTAPHAATPPQGHPGHTCMHVHTSKHALARVCLSNLVFYMLNHTVCPFSVPTF
eukprot:1161671-Pelagomonas_calceolata.AAC.5